MIKYDYDTAYYCYEIIVDAERREGGYKVYSPRTGKKRFLQKMMGIKFQGETDDEVWLASAKKLLEDSAWHWGYNHQYSD